MRDISNFLFFCGFFFFWFLFFPTASARKFLSFFTLLSIILFSLFLFFLHSVINYLNLSLPLWYQYLQFSLQLKISQSITKAYWSGDSVGPKELRSMSLAIVLPNSNRQQLLCSSCVGPFWTQTWIALKRIPNSIIPTRNSKIRENLYCWILYLSWRSKLFWLR